MDTTSHQYQRCPAVIHKGKRCRSSKKTFARPYSFALMLRRPTNNIASLFAVSHTSRRSSRWTLLRSSHGEIADFEGARSDARSQKDGIRGSSAERFAYFLQAS